MQLQERIPLRNSQEFSAIAVTWFNGFWIKNVMLSKRMVSKKAPIASKKAPTATKKAPTVSQKTQKHTAVSKEDQP